MKESIVSLLRKLEAIYFLTQALDANNHRISLIRTSLDSIGREDSERLLIELGDELQRVREYYGAFASDSEYSRLLDDARMNPGYSYLPKLYIDNNLFHSYEKVFPGWTDYPLHALVIFDGQSGRSMGEIFTLDASLFQDLRFHIERGREFRKNLVEFRKRARSDQLVMLSYVRASISAAFHFLEAYLNCLAYDCFHQHHDALALEDHDLLGEWDSNAKRRKFVDFKTKLLKYPRIIAKMNGRTLDLSQFDPVKLLIEATEIRHALTHPSPYVDPHSGTEEKVFWITGVTFEVAEQVFDAARHYVLAVEEGIGRDPKMNVPWLVE